jgi:hypothetical protein
MEITQLLKTLLTKDQLSSLKIKVRCLCRGVPPLIDGDVVVCDKCDGTGYVYAVCRYYAATEDNANLPRIDIKHIGEVAYEILE